MTCRAIIPVKPTGDGKSRLAGVLDADQRAALVDAMLARVIAAATTADHVAEVCLLGAVRGSVGTGLRCLKDGGDGLNPALAGAVAGLADTDRVVVLAGDLPQLSPQDVQLLAAAPPGTVAIAPDRHETGTNALSLPLPDARAFRFAFGEDSFARHQAEAERLGLRIEVIHSPGLARDIDEPSDLPDAEPH